MDVKRCDRCGSIYSPTIHIKDKIGVEESTLLTTKVKKYDLCRKCMGECGTRKGDS